MATQAGIESQELQLEQWIRPSDSRLVPLVLQTAEDPRLLRPTSRWTRIQRPRSRVHSVLRVSYWIGSSIFEPGKLTARYTLQSTFLAALKLGVASLLCILTAGVEGFWPDIKSENFINPDTRYDPVLCPPLAASTPSPDQSPQRQGAAPTRQSYLDDIRLTPTAPAQGPGLHGAATARLVNSNAAASTHLRPRYLCFVQNFDKGSFKTIKVSDYIWENGDDVDLEFVFVSYTRMQFRVATNEEISKFNYPNEEAREANRQLAQRDRQTLINYGIDAARRAGKRAFWLDFECVRNDDGIARATSDSDDVYRICDIVRVAHSMIIVIGPSASDKITAMLAKKETPAFTRENVTPWLRQWGSRLWTLPELLLCPREHRIKLYVAGDSSEPKALAKRNFAERAWDDAVAVKELVDRFENTATLKHDHLIEAALACFSRRQTDQFSQGDIAYAIMGLFPSSSRPSINKKDAGFQAFAKLCLANKSDACLVQLISLAPQPGAPWHDMADRWGAKLRDISPTCRVSEVLGPTTIRLDGVHGATIHWDNLDPEPLFDNETSKYRSGIFAIGITWSAMLTRLAYIFLVILWFVEGPDHCDEVTPMIAWVNHIAGAFALFAPILLLSSRGAWKSTVKPRLIGIEGRANAASLEKQLWGFNHGRLQDTTPQSYTDTDDSGLSRVTPKTDGDFSFSLVDTRMMTLTHFRCQLPPVAMFICGEEDGGTQRALLCSYDWRQKTFQRQTTFRRQTGGRRSLDQMHYMDGIRFSLPPPSKKLPPESAINTIQSVSQTDLEANSADPEGADEEILEDRSRMWIAEVIFFIICIIAVNMDGSSGHFLNLEVHPTYGLTYTASFLIVQPLAYLVLTRVSLARAFRYIVMFKWFLPLLAPQYHYEASPSTITMFLFLAGSVDGFLLSAFVILTWSWYSPREMPLRLLVWALVGHNVVFLLGCIGRHLQEHVSFGIVLVSSVVCLVLPLIPLDLLGRPLEVSWLAPHQKAWLARRAASHKLDSCTKDRTRSHRWTHVVSYCRPLIFFGLSLLTSLGEQDAIGESQAFDEVPMLLVLVIVGLSMSMDVSVSFAAMSMCSVIPPILSILSQSISEIHAGFAVRILTRLNEVVLPLLWSSIVRQTST
ncbi:hypothetical protein NCS56_00497200 [Fusarium sp. Ph1]|nr:hypothetical protein NCS56_00497200 [Fusarium sp. Ph1]